MLKIMYDSYYFFSKHKRFSFSFRNAARGRTYAQRLQHHEGGYPSSCSQTSRRWKEEKEESVHHSQGDQAQAQDCETRRTQVLPCRRRRKDHQIAKGVSRRAVWCRCLHGPAQGQILLRKVRTYVPYQGVSHLLCIGFI